VVKARPWFREGDKPGDIRRMARPHHRCKMPPTLIRID
jgi:hypothetical protein